MYEMAKVQLRILPLLVIVPVALLGHLPDDFRVLYGLQYLRSNLQSDHPLATTGVDKTVHRYDQGQIFIQLIALEPIVDDFRKDREFHSKKTNCYDRSYFHVPSPSHVPRGHD